MGREAWRDSEEGVGVEWEHSRECGLGGDAGVGGRRRSAGRGEGWVPGTFARREGIGDGGGRGKRSVLKMHALTR